MNTSAESVARAQSVLGGVSVVVPARNEAATIEETIDALRRQTYPPVEIIVVDGGSTDETVARLLALAACDPRIRIVEAGTATPGRGRNTGIAAAGCSWIALTDAGVQVESTWLEQLVLAARRAPEAGVVYGTYEPIVDTFFTRAAALAYVSPRHDTPNGPTRGPAAMSMLIQREAWERAGHFPDLRAAEDLLFFDRLRAAGVPAAWAPRATVRWQLRPSPSATFARFAEYSFHNVRAGLQARWHYGLARHYAVALALVVLAIAADARWWIVLGGAVVLRALGCIARRRLGSWWRDFNPVQVAGVVGVLLLVDAATFAGWLRGLRPASGARGARHDGVAG